MGVIQGRLVYSSGPTALPVPTVGQVVENVTALRALVGGVDLPAVALLQYAGTSRLGGGVFAWDATAADDDGLLRFNAGGIGTSGVGWQRVGVDIPTVQMAGAVGDGVTDDTAAIQRAIDATSASLRLRIPAGVYRITDSLAFHNAGGTEFYGFTLEGDVVSSQYASGSGSQLYWDGAGTEPMIEAHAPGMTIRGLVLRVATGKTTVCGIDWDKPVAGLAQTALTVEQCDLDPLTGTMTYGIRVGNRDPATTNLEYMAVDRCTFTRQTEAGIYVPNTSGQSKGHAITRTSFTYSKSGIRIKSGSFRTWGCNFGRLTQAAIEIDAQTDCISIVATDTEECARFLDTSWNGGGSIYPWPIHIDGLRASISDAVHADGNYIKMSYPGGLILDSVLFEYAGTYDPADIKVLVQASAGGTTQSHITSRGCLYLNSSPWSSGSGLPLVVDSTDDWYNTYSGSGPWSVNGWVPFDSGRRGNVRRLNNAGTRTEWSTESHFSGTGSPEGVVVGKIGDVYHQTDGDSTATLWVKVSGTGDTGWKSLLGAGLDLTDTTLIANNSANTVAGWDINGAPAARQKYYTVPILSTTTAGALSLTVHDNTERALADDDHYNQRGLYLAEYTEYRLHVTVTGNSTSANTPRLYVQYSDDDAAWEDLDAGPATISLATTGRKVTSWTAIAWGVANPQDCYLRVAMNGGDGAEEPFIRDCWVEFR